MTKAMIIGLYLDSDIEIGQILQDGMVPPSVPMTVVKAFTQVHIQTEGFCYATNTIVYIQSYITKEPSNQVVWYIRCMPAAADFALRNSSFKNLHKPNFDETWSHVSCFAKARF